MNGVNLRKLFLKVLIVSVVVSAVIGIAVLIFGNFGNYEVRILMTTLTVTAMSIGGLACGAYLETGEGRVLPITGIIFSIVAGLLTFFIIWDISDESEVFLKITATATLIALSCSHLSLLSLARLDRRFVWSRGVAYLCITLLAVTILYLMWFEPEGNSDLVFRVLGILSILVAAVTVITPVFHKLSTGGDDETAAIENELAGLRAKIIELERKKEALISSQQADQ